jgi:outer membrane protein assembly factor BamB
VILETGGADERAFTAFDKNTGEAIWSKGTGSTSYNSPALVVMDGKENIVFANDTMLRAYDILGNELWNFRMPLQKPTAMPVFIPPNKFFVSSVSQTGGFFVEINGNEPKELLQSTTMQNNWSSSCYRDGYLYGFSKAKLQCVSVETGEMQWGKRGYGKGSLIMVGDKLLALSDQGKLVVVKARPEEFIQVGEFNALEGKSWTAPVYANGHIFVRNLTTLACYTISK